MAVTKAELVERVLEAGFDGVGITTAAPFSRWREAVESRPGYPEHYAHLPPWADPRAVLPGARSVICAYLGYHNTPVPEPFHGRIARLYQGQTEEGPRYHPASVAVTEWLRSMGTAVSRTGPRRPAAVRAGVAVQRRNCLAFSPRRGSWISLHLWVVDVDLEPDEPLPPVSCGKCRLCLDACPTGALVEPYVLDPTRCIDHLTGSPGKWIPRELRPRAGSWVYGCDACQEACPHNGGATPKTPPK